MLVTIERRASCSMFARSCKHPIRVTPVVCWLFQLHTKHQSSSNLFSVDCRQN